jgi:hypothetical protein
MLVTLDGDARANISEWRTRQAMIWAHELGHNLGLGDLKDPRDFGRLMFWQLYMSNRSLIPAECLFFVGR